MKLKPCPFCGSGWLYETRRNGYCDETPTMFCNSCKAVVTWEQVEEEGVNDETKAFVREHWNSRAAMEFDNWFYLPKPKERIVDYGEPEITRTENGYKVRQIASVVDEAARKWGEELDEYVMRRICEIWNSRAERTCECIMCAYFENKSTCGAYCNYFDRELGDDYDGGCTWGVLSGARVVGE